MCKIYNKIGSLTTLKAHLDRNNIHDFNSVKEILDFQNQYSAIRQETIAQHEYIIEQEKNRLALDLQQLDTLIETQKQAFAIKLTDQINELKQQLEHRPTYFFQRLVKYLRQGQYKKNIKNKEKNFDLEVEKLIKPLVEIYQDQNDRYQFINSQFRNAVEQSSRLPLWELDRKKAIIDELSSFIYGALGEQKVVNTLEMLSDEYYLINDFAVSFSPALYNKQDNDYIQSIQIDHILVAPSGIFLIETKNWSEKSLTNLNLRSPIQQVKRSSFALFRLLNNQMSCYHLHLDNHHWGDKKIPIKNLIVFTNTKPKEEFQYVKILTLNELIGYVNYFKPIFTNIETQEIADYLINIEDTL